jgi:translocation and assembly module TamB
VVLLLMVVLGFTGWVLRTNDGTRWALVTAVRLLDGQVSGIQGSLWKDVRIGQISVSFPGVSVQASGVHLNAQWRALLERRLHVRDLSVDHLAVQWDTPPEEPDAQPFSMPALPVSIQADHIALNQLYLTQDGVQLPVTFHDFSSAVYVGQSGAQWVLQSLAVQNEALRLQLRGQAALQAMADPWPFTMTLKASASGRTAHSPLCARAYVKTLPGPDGADAACTLDVSLTAQGDMSRISLQANGAGQGMKLESSATVLPAAAFPFRQGHALLNLADGSSVQADVDWQPAQDSDQVSGRVSLNALNLEQLLGSVIPPALLSLDLDFKTALHDKSTVQALEATLAIHQGSRWNQQPVQGNVSIKASGLADLMSQFRQPAHPGDIDATATNSASANMSGQGQVGEQAAMENSISTAAPQHLMLSAVQKVQVQQLAMNLRLGGNRLLSDGGWGEPGARLTLDIDAPRLDQFWPTLPGGARLKGVVGGALARHTAELTAGYTPANSKSDQLGAAPVDLALTLEGGLASTTEASNGAAGMRWQGTVRTLRLTHDEITLQSMAPVPVTWQPDAQPDQPSWRVGQARVEARLTKMRTPFFVLDHTVSQGGNGQWSTRGKIVSLRISPWRVKRLARLFDIAHTDAKDQGGVVVLGEEGKDRWAINVGLDWNLSFSGALQGTVGLHRLSGDVMVPADPDFPLGLQALDLQIQASPANGGASRLTATLNATTAKMGRIAVKASSMLRSTSAGGLTFNPSDPSVVAINAAIDDLAWVSLFTGGSVEFGGKLEANLQLRSKADGTWTGSGKLDGSGLRVVRLDDGIRLLDGTLQAHVEGTQLILDKLYFPARLRVTPKEWRTAEWVSQNPDAKGGGLTLAGNWDILKSDGQVTVDFYRYPLLQRSDRYAMVSGTIRAQADLPKIDVQGQVTADAGWFDLDMLGGIPTVDSDVVVVKPGQKVAQPAVPAEITLGLKLNLGPRFYLTGYGVNSGLVGELDLTMIDNNLRALGALRTRGGAVEAYGQRLQLRRGTITFQGDITSPVLDIEALRTGLQVEAGVRVAGTARRPRIDLVSYPQVSEIEKLSWLLLGHGPNDSGGDVALLFSVGSSFLSDGEPFYRKFGIDEVSMRSGDLGSVGSILPAESVVSSLDSGTSDIERRFISVSKQLASGFTLSVRQALSDTGTIGRVSYQLARGLNAELSVGTINGLALIYRWFSRD